MNDINFNNENADDLNIAPDNKHNNKKLIIMFIIAVILLTVGIGGYFIFKKPVPPVPLEPKPSFPEQVGQCGDSICDAFEKVNPNVCPADCRSENDKSSKTTK